MSVDRNQHVKKLIVIAGIVAFAIALALILAGGGGGPPPDNASDDVGNETVDNETGPPPADDNETDTDTDADADGGTDGSDGADEPGDSQEASADDSDEADSEPDTDADSDDDGPTNDPYEDDDGPADEPADNGTNETDDNLTDDNETGTETDGNDTDTGNETITVTFAPSNVDHGGGVEGVTVEGERHEPDANGEPVTFQTSAGPDKRRVEAEVPPGTYDLVLDAPDHQPVEVTRTLDEDGDLVAPQMQYDLPKHTLTLAIVDASTGEPIENGMIEEVGHYPRMLDSPPEAELENGTAVVDVYEGRTQLRVSAAGYEETIVGYEVFDDETVTVELAPEDGTDD